MVVRVGAGPLSTMRVTAACKMDRVSVKSPQSKTLEREIEILGLEKP